MKHSQTRSPSITEYATWQFYHRNFLPMWWIMSKCMTFWICKYVKLNLFFTQLWPKRHPSSRWIKKFMRSLLQLQYLCSDWQWSFSPFISLGLNPKWTLVLNISWSCDVGEDRFLFSFLLQKSLNGLNRNSIHTPQFWTSAITIRFCNQL